MPAQLLDANEVSVRLGVDRSTVYRMAMDGRLHGVKVGSQWRFPPAALEEALSVQVAGVDGAAGADTTARVPLRRARTAVLEAVAGMLDVTMVVTDMDGRLLSEVVNPCPWFTEHGSDPAALEACARQWQQMAADHVLTPRFDVGSHGFVCARGFVRDRDRLIGMVVAGGIGPDPDDPDGARDAGFHPLDAGQRAELLEALPHVAAALSSLASPRSTDPRSIP